MRVWLSLPCFLALAVHALRAAGVDQPTEQRVKQHASFQYERAPGAEQCPDASVIRRSVGSHLGYDPFDETAGLQVECRVTAQRGHLVAVVNVADRATGRVGERKLVSTNLNCLELADAAALAIAIAIDPLLPAAKSSTGPERGATAPDRGATAPPATADESASSRAPAPSDSASTRAPAPSDSANRERETSPSDEPSRIPFIFSVGAGAALSYALQPTTALALNVALNVRRGPLSVGLEGAWRPPSQVTFLSGTITAQLFSATLLGCGHYRATSACLLADGGLVAGRAEGYLRSARDTTPFLATGLRLGWQPTLFENGSVLFYLSGHVPLVRTTLWVDPESVWTMPGFAAQTGILVFLSLP